MSVTRRMIRRRKKNATVGHVFEEEFALESLKSDRLRVTILIGAIVSSVTILFLLTPIFFDQFQAVFRGGESGGAD